ncbi:MAG: DUF262 domain-containing protein [Bacteroidetes bacterium]|nr:DUF262 domain-containing protein [Bacteroidota bacterium]
METEITTFSYKKISEMKHNNFLRINPEYQRGEVWSTTQQKMLIDSILRNYPIPIIYLHYNEVSSGSLTNQYYEIIDGQQRIKAISDFINGEFKLLDPKATSSKNHFPEYIRKDDTPWANCSFDTLPNKYKEYFTNENIHVIILKSSNNNEVRDLFIRLQAGLPLNAQEKRDAWPGGFNALVLRLGGKRGTKYSGHPFLREHFQTAKTERGNHRKLCAQLAMLFFEQKYNNFIDISSKSIDNFYYRNLDLEIDDPRCKNFEDHLDYLYELFNGFKGPKFKAFEMIDILLFTKDLRDNYSNSWETGFQNALTTFRSDLADARKDRDGEFWYNYSVHTSTSSDKADTIRKRHIFFVSKMIALLNPIRLDNNRTLTAIDKQLIYYKYGQKCLVCFEDLTWNEMEIHHVIPYNAGGQTSIDNSAPVHFKCHPKSQHEVNRFREEFMRNKENGTYGDIASSVKGRKRKSNSPDPIIYASKVDELRKYIEESLTWKKLCDHLGIEVNKDSAKRALERWIKNNRPEWPEIS